MNSKSASWLCLAMSIFAISTALAAQETSRKVEVQTSPLNVRSLGTTSFNRPMGLSDIRGQAAAREQSPFAHIHSLAHQWGRIQSHQNNAPAQAPIIPVAPSSPVVAPDSGFTGFSAIYGAQQASVSGFDLEPPDQGLCTNGGFVFEVVNLAGAVYNATTHRMVSGPVYLNDFFGVAPTDFTSDPRCYFDPATRRWFVTLLDVGPPAGVPTSLLIAVSQTSDPSGTYNLYQIDTTYDGNVIGACPCFGDQPLLGSDANGFYVSTNSFGAFAFAGPQIYAFSKYALILGLSPFGYHFSPLSAPGGSPTPFSLQPSVSPNGVGDGRNGGTEYFVSSFDINSDVNDKVVIWAMTATDTLNAAAGTPNLSSLTVGTEIYVAPIPASQKAGPIPLGKSVGEPEGDLDPDDIRMQQVVYADGYLWSSVSTELVVNATNVDGAAYFILQPNWKKTAFSATVAGQGYVATNRNNLLYPAVGVTEAGKGAMVFTLSGPDYFPSAAYVPMSLTGPGHGIRLAAAGAAPDDGFSIYKAFGGDGVGRWGDYSAAVAVGLDDVWIATEYINGRRDKYTNWGTFIGELPIK